VVSFFLLYNLGGYKLTRKKEQMKKLSEIKKILEDLDRIQK
jgi:hypothetical protein